LNKHLEKYICNHYQELLNISKKLTKNSDWAGDLLQNVILQLYDKKEINLKSIDDNNIKYYIVKCLTINWYSKTSPFYRKVRRESTLYNELYEVMDLPTDDNIFDSHRMLDIMEMEWTEVNWFNKIIFEKYLTMGSLKKVSVDTTIPLSSVARYVNETKTTIKQNTFKRFNDE
jgi:hypothetical protein